MHDSIFAHIGKCMQQKCRTNWDQLIKSPSLFAKGFENVSLTTILWEHETWCCKRAHIPWLTGGVQTSHPVIIRIIGQGCECHPGGSPMCRERRVCEADRDYLFQHFMNRRGVQKWEPLNRRGPQNHEREGVGGPAVQPHIPVLFRI